MSAFQFTIGDTWLISGTLNLNTGDPIPVDGTEVVCTIDTTPPIVLTTQAGNIGWSNEATGEIQIVVRPSDQPDGLVEGVYDFAVRATLADGVVTTQETGTITALEALG